MNPISHPVFDRENHSRKNRTTADPLTVCDDWLKDPLAWNYMETPHLVVSGDPDAVDEITGLLMLEAETREWWLSNLTCAKPGLEDSIRQIGSMLDLRQLTLNSNRSGHHIQPMIILTTSFGNLAKEATDNPALTEQLHRLIRLCGSAGTHLLVSDPENDPNIQRFFNDPRLCRHYTARPFTPETKDEHQYSERISLPLFPPTPLDHDIPNLFDEPPTNRSEEWEDESDTDDDLTADDMIHQLRIGIDTNNQTISWDSINDRHLWLRGPYAGATIDEISRDAQSKGWMLIHENITPSPSTSLDFQQLQKADQDISFIRRTFNDATPLPLLVIIEGLPELQALLKKQPNDLAYLHLEHLTDSLKHLIEADENDVHLLLASHTTGDPRSFASITLQDPDGHAIYLSPAAGTQTSITLF